MKKVVCGFIIGAVVATGIQVSAHNITWYFRNNETFALNDIGEILIQMLTTQEKMYSKLKSIDERLTIENNK